MISIDGAMGEGGGQIVRTSLALSLCLGKPFTIKNIRIKRRKPGLAWQHLAAVNAASKVGNAETQGVEHKSTEFSFKPHIIQGGAYTFDIGTAGSTSLVLQTILPALLQAETNSQVSLVGGTHNPLSPSFDFLEKAYFSVLRKLGAKISAQLIRPGYMPKGGGQIDVSIETGKKLSPIQLNERGNISQVTAVARVAGLPLHIATREIKTIQEILHLNNHQVFIEEQPAEYGPGNVVFIEAQSENITEVFTAYGQPHVPAEKVARSVAEEAQTYLNSEVPVGYHLADQLLLYMALSGKGSIVTLKPSSHTLTNIQVIKQFVDVNFILEPLANNTTRIIAKA